MVKITYDKEARVLAFRLSPKKSVDSEVEDTVVIDRDKNGSIVNIEIMDIGIGEFRKARARADKRLFSQVATR
ncbi:hypothetical protein COU18_02525 [Candidatus Kaiserbacteria bacterium CG10_big_fil_rev_8_21_14_0_10_51_14]|uniref:DUF2283 domain-containing protein n=1 Tax=Candidatus Kaiserbacteria bacterium CG10_big_fil_rev_8_21_14_0_10_51_14 TaxID=1974610 RepID=A0A2H0UAX5_9BACT|nr:MAG: hypothetical protein COU18_02525 [Candidatus Kaiserbacteria bacterium CG10_big_fil_rev_8_21_14_0_10_51_14]